MKPMRRPTRKPQLLSKEQRAEIEAELSSPYGRVVLKADGHELQIRVERYKALQYSVMVYVDGYLRGEWFKSDSDIGAKFWRRRVSQVFSKKILDGRRKLFGKRAASALAKSGSIVQHLPYFGTARAVLATLQRTCESIEVVSIGYQAGEPDEVRKEATDG